jgi:hypothetical protein
MCLLTVRFLCRVFTPDLKGGLPPYEKLQELTYTQNCLREALRKYYIVPVVTRFATEDDVIGGYAIPKGTKIVIPILVRIYDCSYDMYIYAHSHKYICMIIHVHIYMHDHTYTHTFTQIHMHDHTCTHIYMHERSHIYMHERSHIYMHERSHIYMH